MVCCYPWRCAADRCPVNIVALPDCAQQHHAALPVGHCCRCRPQGKRMLHTAAPPSTCKELLQDPQPLPARTCRTGSQHVPAYSSAKAAAVAGQPEKSGQSKQDCGQRRSSRGVASSFSISSGVGSGKAASPGQLASSGEPATAALMHASITSATAAGAPPAAATDTASSGTKKKAGRVEDDPSFFRTWVDAPLPGRLAAAIWLLAAAHVEVMWKCAVYERVGTPAPVTLT